MKELAHLPYLLYMDVGDPAYDLQTKHVLAMKSGALLPFCNRVCGTQETSPEEIRRVNQFYGNVPFRWFVDDQDEELIARLQNEEYSYKITFPAMRLSLNSLKSEDYAQAITVNEFNPGDSQQLQTWLALVTKSFGITPADEFGNFIGYLIERARPGILHFYNAYYQDTPAGTSLLIDHPEVAGLHWVATLPEYRGKGLGYAVSHRPLVDAKIRNLTEAVLLASELGKPVYDKIGFQEYFRCAVYGY